MRAAVVTGGAGFVGGHLVHRLARDGVRVTALDHAAARRPLPAGAALVAVDLRDGDATLRAVADARPEVVFHLAAQSSVTVSMRDPRGDLEHNVAATIEVARAAASAGARRLVFVSSGGAVHGQPGALPANERTPLRPRSIYGASKAAAELYLAVLAEALPLEVAVLRPTNIYGPWQDPHGEAGVVAIFAERMLRGERATIFGDGSQTRDYVFVDDVVEACLAAAGAPAPATCGVATGVETSTRRVFDLIAGLAGYTLPPEIAPERPGDVPRSVLDPSRAAEAWGWRPAVPLEEGLRATVGWFRERVAAAR